MAGKSKMVFLTPNTQPNKPPDKKNNDKGKSCQMSQRKPMTPDERMQYISKLAAENALFKEGDIVRGRHRFEVKKLLEKNTFGFTFAAVRIHKNIPAILKTEANTEDPELAEFKILIKELAVLEAIDNGKEELKKHFPAIMDRGYIDDKVKFLMTSTYGPSLHEIRKMVDRQFQPESAIRISLEMLYAIHALHRLGYVNRNLSPQSFAVGLDKQKRTFLLTDFLYALKFRQKISGDHIQLGKLTRFIGVPRYAPRASHAKIENGRKDDLESWLYISLELFDPSNIPWRRQSSDNIIYDMKKKFVDNPKPDVFVQSAQQYRYILNHIMRLTYESTPDYDQLMDLLEQFCRDRKVDNKAPFEWEEDTKDESTKDNSGKDNEDEDQEEGSSKK